MKQHPKRGPLAVLGVAVAALISMLGTNASAAAPANIDPEATRSLTVHKHTAPTIADSPRGTGDVWEEPPTGAEALSGVTFRAQQVTEFAGQPVNLADTDGWQAIQPLLDGSEAFVPAAEGTTLTEGSEKTTAGDGAATWEAAELPVGLYWITETDSDEHKIAQPAEPFLVTVPTPREDKPGEWIYDVHTYPKNTIVTAAKTVDDDAARAIGDLVTWDVSSTIPANPSHGITINKLTIVDSLLEGLAYDDAYGEPTITETNALGETRTLTSDEYTVTHKAGTVTMSLTKLGRTNVQQNIGKLGGTVTFQFTTMVTGLGATGTLVNNAVVNLNDQAIDVEAATLFGPARIIKISDGDPDVRLDGAEFQIFDTEAAAQKANEAVERGEKPNGALQIGVGDDRTDTFVTDTVNGVAGSVYIPGLKATLEGTQYWLVETRSPAGYVRANRVFEFTVRPGSGEASELSTIEVSNPTRPKIALAVTGGTSGPLLMAGGALVLLAAGTALLTLLRGHRARRG